MANLLVSVMLGRVKVEPDGFCKWGEREAER